MLSQPSSLALSALPQRAAARLRAAGGRSMLLWLLVFTLVLAPALGAIHTALHFHHGMHGTSALQQVPVATPSVQAAAVASGGFLERLFGNHHADADCRVYDQLSHADALPGVAMLVLPLAFSSFVLLQRTGEAMVRWIALFDARGPPTLL